MHLLAVRIANICCAGDLVTVYLAVKGNNDNYSMAIGSSELPTFHLTLVY